MTKAAALKNNPLTVRSEKLPDTPKPVTWRAFNRFAEDAQELLDYFEKIRPLCWSQGDSERTSGDVADDAEWFDQLVARVRNGFKRFDHEENYQEDEEAERVLRSSHIAKRLSVLTVSFPTGAPGSPEGYLKMLTEHVSAVEDLSEVALESGCREVVETQKFLPATSEVLKILREHRNRWGQRRRALGMAEETRQAAMKALLEREAEKQKQQREAEIRKAAFQLQNAVWDTKRWAKEIETAKAAAKAAAEAADAKLASLVQRHAEAEKRESEAIRKLRQISMTPEEAEVAETEAAVRFNGSGPKLV